MRYQWQVGTSPLQEITFSAGKNALQEALIFAPAEITNSVVEMDTLLKKRGLNVSYDIIDNRPVLRVGGFDSVENFLSLLQQNKLIVGNPKVETTKTDKRHIDTIIAAGVLYELGNVTGLAGDFFRKDKAGVTSNMAFIIGNTPLLLFGRKNFAEKQISLMQGFGESLRKNGVVVEAGNPFASEHTQNLPGAWNALRRFMVDKVIGIFAVGEIVAGYKKAVAGFSNQGNSAKGLAGVFIASGFAAGAIIPEKTHAMLRDKFDAKDDADLKEKIKQLPLGKRIVTSIQHTPLFLSGFFSGMNNIFSILGAIDEKKYFEKNNESRKQAEIRAKLSETGEAHFEKSIFGVKTVSVTLDDTQEKSKYWTASGALKKAEEAYKNTDHTDIAATSKALKTKAAAEQNILDLKTDQERLKESRKVFGKTVVSIGKLWRFDMVQALFFFVANFLYAQSPKTGNSFDQAKLRARFFSAAVSQIATASEADQGYLLAAACQYAGDSPDLGVTVREAKTILSEKLQQITANPWLQHRIHTSSTPLVTDVAIHQELPLETMSKKHSQDLSHRTNITPHEKPQAPVSLMDRALMETPAASHAIH